MKPKDNPEEFYSRFHEQLVNSQDWPGKYLFKFILRVGEVNESELTALFKDINCKISRKPSSKQTFVSISIAVEMINPVEVITIYKKAQSFPGVITL